MSKLEYRTVFISDIHLGTRGSKAEFLDDFLHSIKCQNLYLVGDIIDVWALSRGSRYFPQQHVDVIRRILSKARTGTQVKYVIGNHDEVLRKYLDYFVGLNIGNIEIANDFIHTTVDGKKLWVTHGDLYDSIVKNYKWLSHIGDIGYNILVSINTTLNKFRRWYGAPYWSLAGYVKTRVKNAIEFINSFENALVHECKKQKYAGVICGHIHVAKIKTIDGIVYMNDGDWTDSCTALVEHFDGTFEIVNWHTIKHK